MGAGVSVGSGVSLGEGVSVGSGVSLGEGVLDGATVSAGGSSMAATATGVEVASGRTATCASPPVVRATITITTTQAKMARIAPMRNRFALPPFFFGFYSAIPHLLLVTPHIVGRRLPVQLYHRSGQRVQIGAPE